jgi:hypothetical protein
MSGLDALFRFQIGKILGVIALTSALTLVSCSGGSGVTAGVGGSGIGGTGVTLVRGNVATVVAALESEARVRILAEVIDLFSRPVIAQSGSVEGIMVSGGGQADVTDELGRFELIGVTPSPNFVLTLVVTSGQPANLGIGPVAQNSAVQVNNIVIDARQGSATSSSVDVKDNSGSSSDDNESSDNNSSENGTEDGDSSQGDPEDGDSQSEPEDPEDPEDGDSSGDDPDNSGPGNSNEDGDSTDQV